MASCRPFVRSLAFILFAALVLPVFNLTAQSVNPIPFVNQPLAPSSVPPGSSGFTLTVNGTQFVSTSVVNWNGTPLSTTFVNVHQLQAQVPASALLSASTASVAVSSPPPGGGTSAIALFTITNPTSSVAFTTSTIPTGLNPGGVVVADFNNDGKPDLAIVNQDQPDATCYHYDGVGTISILIGNGDGTFSNKSTMCFPDTLGGVGEPQLLAGGFAGNGTSDLVASFYSRGDGEAGAGTFLGNGDGTFTEIQGLPLDEDALGPSTAGDFNRDGKLDLSIPYIDDFGFNNIGVLLGEGNGTFSNFSGVASCNSGPPCINSNAVITGDFNDDGILDLASVDGSVTIFLGNGDGTFTLAPSQPSATMVVSVIAADFNGDGILDLIAGSAILFGNGDGTFTQGPALPPCNPVAVADFNGDGKLDLVCDNGSIFLGNGDGTFHTGYIGTASGGPYGVAVGDFNGDGRLDLAIMDSSNNTVSILRQKPARPGVNVAMISSQNPISINQSATYTAFAWGSPTAPTGSVTFKQGQTVLGTEPLANGMTSFTTTYTRAGSFPIAASYSGDQNYPAKKSQVVTQVVEKYTTYASLESAANPSVYGRVVVLSGTVSNGATTPPTGTVTIFNGSSPLGTVGLANGSARFLLSTHLPAGTLSITAIYNGDASNAKSTSYPLSQAINPTPTTTTVASSPNPSAAGQNVRFTATVTSPTLIPSGTVTFTAGTTTLGTVTLEGGEARLATSTLPAGATTVTATYNGTSNISGSSVSVAQTVN